MDSTVMELRLKRSAFFKWQRICRIYLLAKNQDRIAEKAGQETMFVELSCTENNCQPLVPSTFSASEQLSRSSIAIPRNGFLKGKEKPPGRIHVKTSKRDLL